MWPACRHDCKNPCPHQPQRGSPCCGQSRISYFSGQATCQNHLKSSKINFFDNSNEPATRIVKGELMTMPCRSWNSDFELTKPTSWAIDSNSMLTQLSVPRRIHFPSLWKRASPPAIIVLRESSQLNLPKTLSKLSETKASKLSVGYQQALLGRDIPAQAPNLIK